MAASWVADHAGPGSSVMALMETEEFRRNALNAIAYGREDAVTAYCKELDRSKTALQTLRSYIASGCIALIFILVGYEALPKPLLKRSRPLVAEDWEALSKARIWNARATKRYMPSTGANQGSADAGKEGCTELDRTALTITHGEFLSHHLRTLPQSGRDLIATLFKLPNPDGIETLFSLMSQPTTSTNHPGLPITLADIRDLLEYIDNGEGITSATAFGWKGSKEELEMQIDMFVLAMEYIISPWARPNPDNPQETDVAFCTTLVRQWQVTPPGKSALELARSWGTLVVRVRQGRMFERYQADMTSATLEDIAEQKSKSRDVG
ncbi:hypothetical protein DFH27DRAFT_581905 [Peziza echinospora]|nr:hypothetical protein DFH27DRAFT_581905 [Peziza echinospora]